MERRMFSRWLLAGIAMSITAAAGVAAAQETTTQQLAAESVIEQIKERGSLRVGLSTFVPWAFPNKDGEIVGFEVDVARKLAEDIGVELELVPTAWDGIIPSLIAGKFDVIIGGLTITPARALTVNFTIPYEHSQTLAIVNKKIAPDITTLAQLNSADITFANRRGATTASIAEELFPEAQQLLFDEENASLQELLNGNVQVTLASTPTPSLWEKEYPDVIHVIDEPIRETNEGFAIRKGDPDALAFLNSWITVRSSDGWLDGRFAYWFKGQDWADLVPPAAQ